MELSSRQIKFLSVLLGILVIVSLILFQKEIKNFFYLISSPFQKSLWGAGQKTSDFFFFVFEMQNFKEENEKLKLRIQELFHENIELKELRMENEVLRDALNLGLEKDFDLQICDVLGRQIGEDYLIINKGLRDGVNKDLPVITQQKVLVGKIGEIYDNFSKIQLLTDKNNSFDVKISDKEIYGLAKGDGNLKLILQLIPKEKDIEIGDQVFTSAEGGIFPQNLLVGEITKIKKSDIEPFQLVEINPALESLDFRSLFIIKSFKK